MNQGDGHNAATRLLHVTTVPMTLAFLSGQAAFLRARGIVSAAVSSGGEDLERYRQKEGAAVYAAEMPRRISPFRDLVALWTLCRIVSTVDPAILHAHTPKGGLLGMIAAWLCRVPVRIYHIHGLPYVTATGFKRRLLKWTERVSCRLAHQVLCVSRSVRHVAIADGVCDPGRIKVLGGGSINGVDACRRFNPSVVGAHAGESVRRANSIPLDAKVIGYVGRLVRDKGIVELAQAWDVLRQRRPNLHLLVIGPVEQRDSVPEEVMDSLRRNERVHLLGINWNTPPLFMAMDLVVLPSYREGLPVVPLEAAAMALPVVATKVAGCVDAIADGVTGTLVPPRDATALVQAIDRYLDDPQLRSRHGQAGRERVLREFREEVIWHELYQEYRRLLYRQGVTRDGSE